MADKRGEDQGAEKAPGTDENTSQHQLSGSTVDNSHPSSDPPTCSCHLEQKSSDESQNSSRQNAFENLAAAVQTDVHTENPATRIVSEETDNSGNTATGQSGEDKVLPTVKETDSENTQNPGPGHERTKSVCGGNVENNEFEPNAQNIPGGPSSRPKDDVTSESETWVKGSDFNQGSPAEGIVTSGSQRHYNATQSEVRRTGHVTETLGPSAAKMQKLQVNSSPTSADDLGTENEKATQTDAAEDETILVPDSKISKRNAVTDRLQGDSLRSGDEQGNYENDKNTQTDFTGFIRTDIPSSCAKTDVAAGTGLRLEGSTSSDFLVTSSGTDCNQGKGEKQNASVTTEDTSAEDETDCVSKSHTTLTGTESLSQSTTEHPLSDADSDSCVIVPEEAASSGQKAGSRFLCGFSLFSKKDNTPGSSGKGTGTESVQMSVIGHQVLRSPAERDTLQLHDGDQGISHRQMVSAEKNTSLSAQQEESKETCETDSSTCTSGTADDCRSQREGKSKEDTFHESTVWKLCLQITSLNHEKEPVEDTFVVQEKIPFFKWLYLSERGHLGSEVLGESYCECNLNHNTRTVCIKGKLKELPERAKRQFTAEVAKKLTDLIKNIKTRKYLTSFKTEIITKKLVKKFDKWELSAFMSERKHRLLIVTDNANMMSDADRLITSLLNEKTDSTQKHSCSPVARQSVQTYVPKDVSEEDKKDTGHELLISDSDKHGHVHQVPEAVVSSSRGLGDEMSTSSQLMLDSHIHKQSEKSPASLEQQEQERLNPGLAAGTGGSSDMSEPGKNQSPQAEGGSQVADFVSHHHKISITKAVALFLQQEKILLPFLRKLMSCQITIDDNQLQHCFLAVTRGDVEMVKLILNDMVKTEIFATDTKDPDVDDVLSTIRKAVGPDFLAYLEHTNTMTVVFHSDVAEQVQPYIEELKVVRKELPLPTSLMHYVQCHMQQVVDNMQKTLKFEVSLEPVKDRNKNEVLLIKTNRVHFRQAEIYLDKLFAQLYQRELSVDVGVGQYLQSSECKEMLANIKQSSVVSVQIPGHDVLLTATCPHLGHQLMVCEGNMTTTDSHVMVLPLCERQKSKSASPVAIYSEWSPEYKRILDTGYLATDPTLYAAVLKPPDLFTCTLQWQGGAHNRHVIVMHVPQGSSGKFKDYVSTAVKKAVQSAFSQHASTEDLCIAVPFGFGARDKEWKIILPALLEVLGNKEMINKAVTVKLFLGHVPLGVRSAAQLVGEISLFLSQHPNNWITNILHNNEVQLSTQSRIQIHVGDILAQEVFEKTDVLVNSTDPDLQHKKGRVSAALCLKAGHGLEDECTRKYPEGIEPETLVAVTDSYGLKPVKRIFHVVLSQTDWSQAKEERLLEGLRDRVLSCLALASSKHYQSITFPALGTGNLGYPADKVAKTMFIAVQDFFADMPHSSLKAVVIVCYPGDKQVVKVFQSFSQAWSSQSTPVEQSSQSTPVEQGCRPKEKISKKKQNHDVSKATSSKTRTAKVRVCGTMQAVDQTVKKIQNLKVPAEYQQTDPDMADSSVDPSDYGIEIAEEACEGSKAGSGSTPMGPDCSYFTLPQNMFTKKHIVVLQQNKELMALIEKIETVEEPVPSKRFVVQCSNLSTVVTRVMSLDVHLDEDKNDPTPKSVTESRHKWRKCIQHDDFIALAFLIGEDFKKMFTVINEHNDIVEIECSGAAPPQHMIQKMDFLRREEMQVSRDEALQLEHTPEIRSEVDAFILPVPAQGKVIVYSCDYNALSKAKHLLNVRLGKIKVTSRSRRKFDAANLESVGSSPSQQSPPGSLGHVPPHDGSGAKLVTQDFVTNSGIKVSVYNTDITKLPVDAIVNAANGQLSHGGGVAYAIAHAAGYALEEEGEEYIRKHGPLKVTEVAVTTGGALPCKKVFHAVGPRWSDYVDKSFCEGHLTQTVFNCLQTAHKQGFASLAVSSISSAIFGVPKQICAQCYLTAVKRFEDEYGGRTSLKQIHFVDVSEAMVSTIQNTFTQMWNIPTLPPSSQPVAVNSSSAEARDQGNMVNQDRTTAPKPQSALTGVNTFGTETKSGDTGPGPTGTNIGTGTAFSKGIDTVNFPDRPEEPYSAGQQPKNTGQLESRQEQQRDSEMRGRGIVRDKYQSGHATLKGPQVERFVHEGHEQVQIHFQGLDLIFQSKHITDIHTDVIVLWQNVANLFADFNSQQIVKEAGTQFESEVVPRLKARLRNSDLVEHLYGKIVLILPCVCAEYTTDWQQICKIVEKIFSSTACFKRRTVAIPGYPYEKASKEQSEGFAVGLYMAIKKHLEKPNNTITEVHIVDRDTNYLATIVDLVSQELALDLSTLQADSSLSSSNTPMLLQSQRSVETKCSICLGPVKHPKALDKCGHTFCSGCLSRCFATKPVCPECQTVYGTITGNQPLDGKMKMYRKGYALPGFPKTSGTFVIEYDFPPGTQTDSHPEEGAPYKGTHRKAYLPDCPEGRKVLMLLKVAFDRQLIFTVGQSATRADHVGVIWNDIHHKTDKTEGSSYGYPDATYLSRVQEELAAKGVTYEDLTEKQKKFIRSPESSLKFFLQMDFSDQFNKK